MLLQVLMVQAIPLRLSLHWWCGELGLIMLRESQNPRHTLMGIYKVLLSKCCCLLSLISSHALLSLHCYLSYCSLRLGVGAPSQS